MSSPWHLRGAGLPQSSCARAALLLTRCCVKARDSAKRQLSAPRKLCGQAVPKAFPRVYFFWEECFVKLRCLGAPAPALRQASGADDWRRGTHKGTSSNHLVCTGQSTACTQQEPHVQATAPAEAGTAAPSSRNVTRARRGALLQPRHGAWAGRLTTLCARRAALPAPGRRRAAVEAGDGRGHAGGCGGRSAPGRAARAARVCHAAGRSGRQQVACRVPASCLLVAVGLSK